VHSNTCSGSAQASLEFAHIFASLQGSVTASPNADGIQLAVADTNPADAPFPQWAPNASYPLGYKVVEAGEIYQALWYNNGQDPAAQQGMSQGPWELLGPVLPGDHGPHIARLRSGTYPAWSLSAPVPGHRQGALRGTALPGQVVQPGNFPGESVNRPVRVAVGGDVRYSRRASGRTGPRPDPRKLMPRRATLRPSRRLSPQPQGLTPASGRSGVRRRASEPCAHLGSLLPARLRTWLVEGRVEGRPRRRHCTTRCHIRSDTVTYCYRRGKPCSPGDVSRCFIMR
jgi:hypothetical protein